MSRIELPPKRAEDLEQLLEDAKAMLPIAGCLVSKNDLLGSYESVAETEYQAPAGKSFRISGEFMLSNESNDVSYSAGTLPYISISVFEREQRDEIDDQRVRRGISYEEALDELVENARQDLGYIQTLPYEFIGKKIAIRTEKGKPVVYVKGPVDADMEGAYSRIELPIADSHATETYLAGMPFIYCYWKRTVAYGPTDACRVELVDYEDPQPQLYIPQPHPDDTSFWTPLGTAEVRILGAGRAARNRRGFVVTSEMPNELVVEPKTTNRLNDEDIPF